MTYEYMQIIRAQSTIYYCTLIVIGVLMCILVSWHNLYSMDWVPDVPALPSRADQSRRLLLFVPNFNNRKVAEIKMFRCFPKRFLTAGEVLKRNFQLLHTLHSSSSHFSKKNGRNKEGQDSAGFCQCVCLLFYPSYT